MLACTPTPHAPTLHTPPGAPAPQAGANAEVIKRWTSEVQEAINSRHPMVSQAVELRERGEQLWAEGDADAHGGWPCVPSALLGCFLGAMTRMHSRLPLCCPSPPLSPPLAGPVPGGGAHARAACQRPPGRVQAGHAADAQQRAQPHGAVPARALRRAGAAGGGVGSGCETCTSIPTICWVCMLQGLGVVTGWPVKSCVPA